MSEVQHAVDLTSLNTLHLNSHADNFISLKDLAKLEHIRALLSDYQKFFVLGGGSNLILPENYDGLVIHNQLMGISVANLAPDYALITAMAGENWDKFVAYCVKNGYYGIENLSLIPGTVGASPVQNIGAYGVEVKDFIESVLIYDWEVGEFKKFSNSDCQFSYRNSFFKNKARYLVVSVTFKLLNSPKLNTSYGDVAKHLAEIASPTPLDLRNIIIKIRSNKLPNPDIIGNAGSFFHNPIISKAQADKLLLAYPNLPVFPVADSTLCKVSAGWLIDNLGLKGFRQGNVGVYAKQALVLVNHGGATQHELLGFANFIQQKVNEKYQINLNIEPIII